tara:strand:+ start:584 stop:1384 length:801 start_codon:yes stop_codon:yes gene_type:complete
MKFIYSIVNVLYNFGLTRLANYFFRYCKNFKGFYQSFISKPKIYEKEWWDENFYDLDVTDSDTISASIDKYSSAFHFASIELLITKELFLLKDKIDIDQVLDIGSGAGHWIDFYKNLGAKNLVGIEVSNKAINFLSKKYDKDLVKLHQGDVFSSLKNMKSKFNLINAIGIMFHLVDDLEWENTIGEFSSHLHSGGILIVTGYFGFFNGLNVQRDKNGVNKRLRSKFMWQQKLNENGFYKIKFVKNKAAYSIKRLLPENNILIAMKR